MSVALGIVQLILFSNNVVGVSVPFYFSTGVFANLTFAIQFVSIFSQHGLRLYSVICTHDNVGGVCVYTVL